MKKFLVFALVLGAFSSSVLAYDGNKILIIPNKQQRNDGYGHNIISNSDVAIIIQEPADSQRHTYKRKNYQKDFREQNIYDPRNLNEYQPLPSYNQSYDDYDQGYNDGYNDARRDYRRDGRTRSERNQDRVDDMFYGTFMQFMK